MTPPPTAAALPERPWMPIYTAPENVSVETKIDDEDGCRNEQSMMRRGRLWWVSHDDVEMYVYYTPTHWRPLP